ncbi:yjeF-related protein [Rhodotorula toruloides]|uniref:Enhancer of mRNA-decapping protein 3 n=1 Tax=Rhodotorula toruloides TaxID=5286 RepID=A0A511KLU9_RHOTO|nr:yjeF-related protein [Rhodotorula toruloides]
MASAFIGLPVLVKLRSGPNDAVRGVLSSLDPVAGTLTLTEARSTIGGVERLDGIRLLAREEVAGLELLSVDRGAPLQTNNTAQGDGARRSMPQKLHAQHAQSQPAYLSPSPAPSPSPLSGSPRSAEQARKRGNRAGRRKQEALQRSLQPNDEYPSHSPSHTPSFNEDFDFGAGLATFDKKAVFEQIRSHDDTDPALRLVAHNRNPSRTPQTKMLPSESVLSPQELYDQRQEALSMPQLAGRDAKASMTPTDMSRRKPEDVIARQRQTLELDGEAGSAPAKTLLTGRGVPVPAVKAKQWKEALSIAEIESAPTTSQRHEASAIALTTYILSHLCLSQNLLPLPSPPHSRPSVCLLCTDAEKSYIAIRAGVTLANRGCRVVALVEDGGEGKSEAWKTAVRVLSSAGGRIVRDVADLAKYNLIIDALASPLDNDAGMLSPRLDGTSTQTSAASTTALSVAAAEWANEADAPIVSQDVPFGVNADTGLTLPSISTSIHPTHILFFGLPRACSLSSSSPILASDTHIALADVGFSPALWQRVGVEDFDAGMWAADSLVELRRA